MGIVSACFGCDYLLKCGHWGRIACCSTFLFIDLCAPAQGETHGTCTALMIHALLLKNVVLPGCNAHDGLQRFAVPVVSSALACVADLN